MSQAVLFHSLQAQMFLKLNELLKNELKSSSAGGIKQEKAKELTNYQQIISSVQCSNEKMPCFSRSACFSSRLLKYRDVCSK